MRPMPKLTVEQCATADLVPYANNAKIHTNEQLTQIENSIKEFGFNDPVAVWQNENDELEIIEGHGRVLAAKNLQINSLPIIRLDHLTDEQRRAYTHIHNQLTLNTSWDFETLDFDLDALDFDFSDFGFTNGNFDAIDDLLNEDFASYDEIRDKEFFSVTFVLPASEKETFNAYLKENGKDELVDLMLKQVQQWV